MVIVYLHAVFLALVLYLYVNHTPNQKIWNTNVWHTPQKIWTWEKTDGSQQLIDYFSFTHISHGIILYNLIKPYTTDTNAIWISLFLEIVFELFENTNVIINRFRESERSKDYKGDSLVNIIGDIWCTLIGIIMAQYLPFCHQLAYVVLSELFLYHIIQDNLTYNIIQIFGKAEKIKSNNNS